MEKLKITDGEHFTSAPQNGNFTAQVFDQYGGNVAIFEITDYPEEATSNAKLLSNSLITYNKCHKLPSELLEDGNALAVSLKETIEVGESLLNDRIKLEEHNREMVEALKDAIHAFTNFNSYGYTDFSELASRSEALLTKIENKDVFIKGDCTCKNGLEYSECTKNCGRPD